MKNKNGDWPADADVHFHRMSDGETHVSRSSKNQRHQQRYRTGRIERLNRVYGYAIGLADLDGNAACITKLAQLHDHKGNLIVIWHDAPTDAEKDYFLKAWLSQVGDGTVNVMHEIKAL